MLVERGVCSFRRIQSFHLIILPHSVLINNLTYPPPYSLYWSFVTLILHLFIYMIWMPKTNILLINQITWRKNNYLIILKNIRLYIPVIGLIFFFFYFFDLINTFETLNRFRNTFVANFAIRTSNKNMILKPIKALCRVCRTHKFLIF